jgi:hypothetical protein
MHSLYPTVSLVAPVTVVVNVTPKTISDNLSERLRYLFKISLSVLDFEKSVQ